MKSKGRPQTGADPEGQPPPEVIDRLAGLLPEGALEDAVRGLRPEQLYGPGRLLSELAGRVAPGQFVRDPLQARRSWTASRWAAASAALDRASAAIQAPEKWPFSTTDESQVGLLGGASCGIVAVGASD